ncbi:MAG: M61 family metallopeptidase [Rhodanobacteraceae bacterium]
MPPRRKSSTRRSRSAAATAAAAAAPAWADSPDARIPEPQDKPYAGTIAITVDASDTSQGIFRVHEAIPVAPGELLLLYPKWIPAHHSPTGPIDKLAGLTITAGGKPVRWTRDKYDVYAFHIDVPKGVAQIDVVFQYLSPRNRGEGPIEMTPDMLDLIWDKVSLYPAGRYTRQITVAPSVTLPPGWQFGTALEMQSQSGDTYTFKPVTYETLVDSPMYAGRHFKRLDLDPGAKVPVHMAIVADAPKCLEVTPRQLQVHRNLVQQAYRLFGSHHYDHYDFLVSLSDQMGGKGVEHHQSSEDSTFVDYFTDWKNHAAGRDLFAHEFEHSWNGKFRRPADLWTPNFNVPMGDSLLWVYEGQTQYWGFVLTARAGLWSSAEFHDALAQVAARYDRERPGFEWRNIQDTTNDPTISRRSPKPYRNWQMSEDYYSGGQLVWLAVDAKLRSLTRGRKSLDTFAKAFFGVDNGSVVPRTYTFDDVIAALDGVAKHDWAEFLRSRIDANAPPMDGIEASGWKLVYTDKQSEYEKQLGKRYQYQPGFMYSIGLAVGKDGVIRDVLWNGPAFKAGIGSGGTLVAVNGHAYKPELLEDAIKGARGGKAPIELLVKQQDHYRTVPVDYHDGLKYPHLERIKDAPDHLSRIIEAR